MVIFWTTSPAGPMEILGIVEACSMKQFLSPDNVVGDVPNVLAFIIREERTYIKDINTLC